jgi:hypothetical protein
MARQQQRHHDHDHADEMKPLNAHPAAHQQIVNGSVAA